MKGSRTGLLGIFLSIAVVTAALSLSGQEIKTQAQMHERIASLYNFSPSKVTNEQRATKSAEMDAFWNDVKARQNLTLPMLRAELKNTSNPPFFMEDGSSLLLSLSRSKEDEAVAAEAMSRADLKDVAPGAYFYAVHQLSMHGADTTRAALHILDDPKFHVDVPAHAMTLDMRSCLLYLLLPVRQDLWMEAAGERFNTQKDEAAQQSLLMLFFYSQTKEGDAFLEAAAHDESLSEGVRRDAQQWLKDEKEALGKKTEIKGDETSIREARRNRMSAVSDESIDDVQEMTVRLAQLRHRS